MERKKQEKKSRKVKVVTIEKRTGILGTRYEVEIITLIPKPEAPICRAIPCKRREREVVYIDHI